MNILIIILSFPIKVYRLVVSPLTGSNCRFQPTCSEYALEALRKHGALQGSLLSIRRIARCNPFGGSGFDPVPGRKQHNRDL